MKPLHACGLAMIVASAALGLLVNPAALLAPVGFFAVLLFLRFPEALALCAIAIGMLMSHAQIINLGFPSVGVNLLDFAVFLMLFSVIVRWPEIKGTISRDRRLRYVVWFVAVAGTVALVNGYFGGYHLRTALRSFRFYFHLIVTFHFAALIPALYQLRRIVVGWMLLVPIQLYLLYTHTVVYSPDDPGSLILAPDIYWTSIHFLPIKTFFPMLIALALLALGGHRVRVPTKAGLWTLLALQILVLAFSYKRAHYVGIVAALLVLLLGILAAGLHRGRRLVPLLAKQVGIALTLIFLSSFAFFLTGPLAGVDTEKARESIENRFFFVRQMDIDAPIQERLEGLRIGWDDIQRQPLLGTGLGHSVSYQRAQIFHSGWLWIAVSAGLPAALGLMLAVGLCCTRTLKTLGHRAENPVLSALRLGFLASLVALGGTALFWGSTLDIADVVDWGLLMGLLAVLTPEKSRGDSRTANDPRVGQVRTI